MYGGKIGNDNNVECEFLIFVFRVVNKVSKIYFVNILEYFFWFDMGVYFMYLELLI